MHETIDAQTNGGLALLSALTTDRPLYYPTTLGTLLPIQRYNRDLIEPDKVYFDLPETHDFQPLLIDSAQSLITIGGKDIHLDRAPERVVFNCLLAQKGNGWFSGRDVSLALLANGMDRARFTPTCKALGRIFTHATGVELFITTSARRANSKQFQLNPRLVPISRRLILESIDRPDVQEESAPAETEEPARLHVIADPERDNLSTASTPTGSEPPTYNTLVSIQPARIDAPRRVKARRMKEEARRTSHQSAPEEVSTEASPAAKRAHLPSPDELGPISKTGIPSLKTTRDQAVLPEVHHAKDDALERHLAQSANLNELREAENQALLDILNSGYLDTIDADVTFANTRNHPVDEEQSEEEKSWQHYANCLGVDPELFFPTRGASTKEAKEVCRSCVVREDCLESALAGGEKFGIWGGASERERRRIRRQRALARAASTT